MLNLLYDKFKLSTASPLLGVYIHCKWNKKKTVIQMFEEIKFKIQSFLLHSMNTVTASDDKI